MIWIGMEANWVPFEYVDGAGQLTGFDVELAWELGKRLELEVQFVANLSFDGLYDALTAGRVDAVISAVVVDVGRSADYSFSTPYFEAGQVLVVGSAGADIARMQDLPGRVLAVELGSDGDTVARRWARRLVGLTLLHTDSALGALSAVADGQADAALTDRATALMLLKACYPQGTKAQSSADRQCHTAGDEGEKRRDAALQISGDSVTEERYAIVVRNESLDLLRALNVALANMRSDGVLQALERKWVGP